MALFDLFRPSKKIENPANPITPEVIRQSLYSGGVAQYDTSPDYGALRYTPIFAAESLIAETIASLPICTYQRLPDNGREAETDSVQYTLLHQRPNEFQTPSVFWDSVIRCAIRKGNSFVYIERTGANDPVNLLLLDSLKVQVKRTSAGKVYYYNHGEYVIPDGDIIHIMGMSNDGINGVPLCEYAGTAIALGMAAEQYGLKFFTHGASVNGTIELNAWPNDTQFKQLRESWESAHSGLNNAHKTAIIPNGTYKNTTIPNEQAQYLETRRWQLLEVCRLFRIPPHMLGDLERGTFSNIEQQSIEFISGTIRPWLVRIEQEINRKLFSPSQQGEYFAAWKLDAIMRGDTTQRYAAYNVGRQGGWLSINEIRQMENLPPVDGGDELLTPLNMGKVGQEQEQPGDSAADAETPADKQGEDNAAAG